MEVRLDRFSRECTCGKAHKLFVKHVLIEAGAINEINALLEETQLNEYPVVICDTNTYDAAGKHVFNLLRQEQKDIIILNADCLHADEHGVEKVIESLRINASVLLAVGAGTIHDITRYVAKEKNIPFISVPTAASVDGFVSTVAAMTIKGLKVTYPAVSPLAVFADTHVFMKAPYRLTASGIADLLGKYTAILDWQIAHLLTNEYICENVVNIELEAVKRVVDDLEAIQNGSEEAYENLMYALILSGLAMQMTGNSRPASGAEHHLSHLWEMHVINKRVDALHGEKVGVALAIAADTYRKILEIEDIKEHVIPYTGFPYELLKENFGELFDSIIEENTPDLLEEIDLKKLISKFEDVKDLVKNLPSGDEIRSLLSKAHAVRTLEEIGLDHSILEKSIQLSPFVRRRLTLMRILKLLDYRHANV
jgi:glycerol-1-phosphate dehydrogenase [NAD(P)+]